MNRLTRTLLILLLSAPLCGCSYMHKYVDYNGEKVLTNQRRYDYVLANPHLSETRKRQVLDGKLVIGMTKKEAELARAKPNRINYSATAYGSYEQWVYGTTHCYYLYFHNGILTGWN